MSLGLKVDVCFSNLPKKLSVVVFGSPFLFLKFLIHFSRFSEDPLGRGETRKVSHKVFFPVYDRTHQYMITQFMACCHLIMKLLIMFYLKKTIAKTQIIDS